MLTSCYELTELPDTFFITQILKECLASLGLVRGVPEGEFHALVSTLRDRAEKAARGFVSVEVGRDGSGGVVVFIVASHRHSKSSSFDAVSQKYWWC